MAILNVLWVGLGATIVLFPAATAALFEAMHELASGREPGVRDFLVNVRRRFIGGWAWALLGAAVSTIVGVNVAFYLSAGDALGWVAAIVVVIGSLLAVSLLYVWPFVFLQAEGGLGRAIRNALLTTVAAPLFSLTLFAIVAVALVASAVLVVPLIALAPALVCLIASRAVTDRLRAFGKLPAEPVLEAE